MAFGHHLHDERLLDCYVAERAGDALDPPTAEHLVDCEACAARYAEFAGFMNGLKADAEAETDAIFTAERLQAQRAAIAHKIAAVGRVARVISFPGRLVSRHMDGSGSRIAPRWLAAAAAAGLLVGIGAGQLLYGPGPQRNQPLAQPVAVAVPAALERVEPPSVRLPNPVNDDAFLSDLELAIQRPRTRELLAFDAMTPHAREITLQLR